MITLFSYPGLFGLADNNGYGLKVYAWLRLAGLPFTHRHVFDPSAAPRAQLPYITDGDDIVGDSDAIIAHLAGRHGRDLDAALAPTQRHATVMLGRVLDDLYWVMSYSRWKDEAFWPQFAAALRDQHPSVTQEDVERARAFNAQRYHFQGIGRFAPPQAYARGIADLDAIDSLLADGPFLFGPTPASADAALYGFLANILFYPIETPLKRHLEALPRLVAHCRRVHARIA